MLKTSSTKSAPLAEVSQKPTELPGEEDLLAIEAAPGMNGLDWLGLFLAFATFTVLMAAVHSAVALISIPHLLLRRIRQLLAGY